MLQIVRWKSSLCGLGYNLISGRKLLKLQVLHFPKPAAMVESWWGDLERRWWDHIWTTWRTLLGRKIPMFWKNLLYGKMDRSSSIFHVISVLHNYILFWEGFVNWLRFVTSQSTMKMKEVTVIIILLRVLWLVLIRWNKYDLASTGNAFSCKIKLWPRTLKTTLVL